MYQKENNKRCNAEKNNSVISDFLSNPNDDWLLRSLKHILVGGLYATKSMCESLSHGNNLLEKELKNASTKPTN